MPMIMRSGNVKTDVAPTMRRRLPAMRPLGEVRFSHTRSGAQFESIEVEESSEESESSEEEVVYVQRKKPAKKVKKAPRVVYVSDSESEDEAPHLTSIYSFV